MKSAVQTKEGEKDREKKGRKEGANNRKFVFDRLDHHTLSTVGTLTKLSFLAQVLTLYQSLISILMYGNYLMTTLTTTLNDSTKLLPYS